MKPTKTHKACTKCGETLPVEAFGLSSPNKNGIQYRRSRCVECNREDMRIYNQRSYQRYRSGRKRAADLVITYYFPNLVPMPEIFRALGVFT